MKTIILTLFLAATSFAQIELVASATDTPRGVPIAYFIDKDSIVSTKNEVTFVGFETGVKTWKDSFEIDTSEFLIISDIWMNCETKRFKILRVVGTTQGLTSATGTVGDRPIPKGSVIDIISGRVCGAKKLKA